MGKLRITRYNPDNTIYEDRLIDSKLEFYNGPDTVHYGPLRIDALLQNTEECEGLINYLKQLIGQLPISKKEQKQRTSTTKPLEADSIQTLIAEAFEKCKTQEALIEYLRGLNFTFLTYDHLKDICDHNEWPFKLKKKKYLGHNNIEKTKYLHKDYQFMVRVLKLAKNPQLDKIDPQIFFGFKLIGEKRPKVLIYELGIYKDTKELHWKEETEIGYKVKEKFYKFPEPMSYIERSKWRGEDRRIVFDQHKGTDKQYKPSDFYTKWKPWVVILKDQRKKVKK